MTLQFFEENCDSAELVQHQNNLGFRFELPLEVFSDTHLTDTC